MVKVYGPYKRKDGRRHVVLYSFELGVRKTVSYPKYLMEQKLGRELQDWETVDHIDNDFTNDAPNNLQILTRKENASKSAKFHSPIVLCKCDLCGIEFTRQPSLMKSRDPITQIKKYVFCSNICRLGFGANQYN